MNRNLNVFWGLVLCVGMIVGLTVLTHRSVSESDYGNPNEFYNSSSARTYSHVSSSAAVADGVGVPMRSTSSMRRGSSFVYAPAYTTPNSPIASSPNGPIASSPNGPIASSPISYTSSSATAKSFGSGIGAGVSMSGGAVRSAGGSVSMSGGAVSGSFASSPLASSPNGPIALSPNSLIASSPVAITDPAQAAASYDGIGNTTIGGPRGMRGRLRLPGTGGSGNDDGFANDWLAWLAKNAGAYVTPGADGNYGFDIYKLRAAYEAWRSGWMLQSGLSEEYAPSFDDFLTWFWSNEGNHTYTWVDQYGDDQTTSLYWVPVGEIWPLLVIALLYVLFLAIKSKPLKSLLTAKRSE